MKTCADCKLDSLLFFGAMHVDSRSSVSNGSELRLKCLVDLIWHFFGILRSTSQNSLFKSED